MKNLFDIVENYHSLTYNENVKLTNIGIFSINLEFYFIVLIIYLVVRFKLEMLIKFHSKQ